MLRLAAGLSSLLEFSGVLERSELSRRLRARPHRRYSGSESTSRATNIVSRSLEAGKSSMPPTANISSISA